METVAELRARLAYSGLRQVDIAGELGMDEAVISKILRGGRPMPEGFPERFHAAIETVATRRAEHLLAVAAGEGS